jgi:RNA polymerase sigma-70 factor (ECF subfamily)
VAREEVERQVRETLENMEESDREIVALRNFEQLSNGEAAAVLGIGPSTASSRYLRALQKIKATLRSLGIEGV